LKLVMRTRGKHQARTFASKGERNPTSNSTAGAGDESDLVRECSHAAVVLDAL
jgi:hypothetical protein